MVGAVRFWNTPDITATCHLSHVNAPSSMQVSTPSLLPTLCWSL